MINPIIIISCWTIVTTAIISCNLPVGDSMKKTFSKGRRFEYRLTCDVTKMVYAQNMMVNNTSTEVKGHLFPQKIRSFTVKGKDSGDGERSVFQLGGIQSGSFSLSTSSYNQKTTKPLELEQKGIYLFIYYVSLYVCIYVCTV